MHRQEEGEPVDSPHNIASFTGLRNIATIVHNVMIRYWIIVGLQD